MSIYDKDLLSGKDKVETAIERIRMYCRNKKVLVAFSGGKDSQCCYHLCKMAGIDFQAQYSITRFEPPELIRFVREHYPDVKFRRAYKMSLVDEIARRGLPNRWVRWCCEYKHKRTDGFDISVVGVRFEESPRRRDTWRMFGKKGNGETYICPICDWTINDVWEFLNSNNIPHCSIYDEGYRRIGCVCCPLAPGKGDEKRWPKLANAIRVGWEKYWDKKEKLGFVDKHGIVIKDFLLPNSKTLMFENWIQGGVSSCVTRSVEGDEPCLFAGTGFSESDGIENQKEES